METTGVRINKYLSEIGFCSRREADRLIEQGKVTVNDKVPEVGLKITDQDVVKVDGKLVQNKNEKPVYLVFNKPLGIESTTDTQKKNNIVDFIGFPQRIFPIGRLDKDSEGLIFMTSDGDIVNKILRARNNHEKEYIVSVDKPITAEFIKTMSNGIPMLGTVTNRCKVEKISQKSFRIILTQGLNRQIRRMCDYCGYRVVSLKRIRIMNISLDVKLGEYRHFTDKEIKDLNQMIASSDKTEDASLSSTKNKKFTGKRNYDKRQR